jgi:hypothetical protein
MELTILLLTVVADVGLLCFGYLLLSGKAYAKKKGENLATREDIGAITRQIEAVRAEYAEKLQTLIHDQTALREATQQRHQLSMAALDKRLQAHQTAYYLWREILIKFHKNDDDSAFFDKCDIWWAKHCLYLSPDVDKAFRAALSRVSAFSGGLWGSAGGKMTRESLMEVGDLIRKAVQLPPIPRDELGLPASPQDAANSPER